MTIEFVKDPRDRIKEEIHKIINNSSLPTPDDQELKEREEAAQAYAGENEQHFVDYCKDCIKQSVEANRDVRKVQAKCWDVFQEKAPPHFSDKEDWQSKVVIPKPFGAVMFAMAAVKKGFSPDYLSINDVSRKDVADFYQKIIEKQLDGQHANFRSCFCDATGMGFAVGQSLEMVPQWLPGKGLQYALIEPWKIHRDPDAVSKDPQSGMFWIHQEWLDYWVLKEGEKAGRYFDVKRIKDITEENTNPHLTKEAIAERKQQIWQRSSFRTMHLVSEFWGQVLSPKGELLLPSAFYTIAGEHVIKKPKKTPFKSLRWPGVSFSPIPNFLGFGGRGILQSVISIWEMMCDLMCLHVDNLQWIVNPMTEIILNALEDTDDWEPYPGKSYVARETINGQQAVRNVQRRSTTTDVLANMQYGDQNFQRGTFVTDGIQGLPGYRKDITFRESRQNLGQGLSVFGLMGENIEIGAAQTLQAGLETIRANIGIKDIGAAFKSPEEYNNLVEVDPNTPTGVRLPEFDGNFHVSGMSALLKENETMMTIKELVAPMAASPVFGKYMKPYNIIKGIIDRANLKDEGVVVTSEEGEKIDEQVRQMMIAMTAAAQNQGGTEGEQPA